MFFRCFNNVYCYISLCARIIVPLLGITFFGFAELEMSYFLMYIGVVQILLHGVLIGRLTARWGEENLMAFGSLIMGVWDALYATVSQHRRFYCIHHFEIIRHWHLNTVLPSFISKRTPADEQGGMLVITQSVGSIARIPSPLVGGIVAEIAGLDLAFYQRSRSNVLLFPWV